MSTSDELPVHDCEHCPDRGRPTDWHDWTMGCSVCYGYPAEHYAFWPRAAWRGASPGRFRREPHHIGGAELVVTQPRLPCVKLNTERLAAAEVA